MTKQQLNLEADVIKGKVTKLINANNETQIFDIHSEILTQLKKLVLEKIKSLK